MAAKTRQPVEILSKRTENSETHVNPSGTLTLTQHAVPVRVKRGNGWVPIDTNLVAGRDGVRPVAASTDIVLSGGGTGPLVTVGADGTGFGLTWPAALPKPLLAGDTATYPDVFPGVDLTIRVEANGFAKTLVVKNRAAAGDPRLARITFGLTTRGLTVKSRPDGGFTFVDGAGEVVFAGDAPMMWDRPQAPPGYPEADPEDYEPRHTATMPLEVSDRSLTIVPDQSLLTGAETAFPVSIDPSSVGIGNFDWTHVNKANGGTSYWNSDRTQAKVGYAYWSPTRTPWRSFFLFSTANIIGKQVTEARFGITLDHSGSCGPTQVRLYHVWPNISRAGAVTWNNTTGHWVTHVANGWGNANEDNGCNGEQPDMPMYFGLPSYPLVTTVVQNAAAGHYGGQVTFGLMADNEGDRYQWKKFYPSSAVLTVEYNTPPSGPAELSTVPATPCGTETAPTRLGASFLTMGFSAQLRDDDGNLVQGQLQVLRGATETLEFPAAPATTYDTVQVARGAVAVWPPLPVSTPPANVGLEPDTLYSYRARTHDGTATSAWTNRCFFIIDDDGPAPPAIESTDYPEWTPVRDTGDLGTVTFRHGAADTDVAGYYYGFSADRLTGWVPADVNGDATVPVTLWRDPNTGTAEAQLYVQAEDTSGNRSGPTGPYVMLANDNGATPPGVGGDVNGDGLGDVTALFDMGDDRLRAWTVTSTGSEFHTSYVGWDTGPDGSSFVTMRAVQGEFTGDGLTDQALFRQDPDGRTRLFILRSGGHRFDVLGDPVWTSPPDPKWTLANMKVAAGNVDGTGPDDIVALVNSGSGGWAAQVWTAAAGHASTTAWYTQPDGTAVFTNVTALVGDFDADGDADLATVTEASANRLAVFVHDSTGSSFGAGAQRLDAPSFDYRRARYAVGNFDGDTTNGRGRVDLVALYDNGGNQSRLITFRSTGTGFSAAENWWPAGGGTAPFDSRTSTLLAADFNGDGRTDVAAFNDCCKVGNRELWAFTSTGTGFANQQRVQELTVANKRRAIAHWKVDAGSGTALFDEYGENPATTAGSPAWRPGRTMVPSDNALSMAGNQWAATAGPVVRTDRSFTVSAWVYQHAPVAGWRGAVSQDGALASGFMLRWADNNRWVFTLMSSDTMNAPHLNLVANREPRAWTWTHLTGVYDAQAGEARLYVNGALDAVAPWAGGFNATGPLNIGRDRYNGVTHSTWIGGVDDVQIRDHVMSAYEIAELANNRPLQAHWKLGGATGGTDASGNANPVTFANAPGATSDRAGNAGGALAFNGTNQYGTSTRPVLSGGSYTVSAWLKLDATGGGTWPGAVSQEGSQASSFFLRYCGPLNNWVFTVVYDDVAAAPHVNLHSNVTAQAGVWTHVAGVYDAGSGTVRIYVNGTLEGMASVPRTFYPGGPLNIGRDKYNGIIWTHWKGGIDDVRVHAGALSEDEIKAVMAAAP
jgi:hypothetical protein